MSKLLSILKEGDEKLYLQGGESHMEEQLASHRQRLFVSFLIMFVVLILLIVIGVIGIWHLMDCANADQLKALLGALGLAGGSGGVVEVLRRIWVQWSYTSLVLGLIADAPKSLKAEIVRELIKKLD